MFDVFISKYSTEIINKANGMAARFIVKLVQILIDNAWKKVLVSAALLMLP
jgi:hypothetical protein